jgi:hypothetical protein
MLFETSQNLAFIQKPCPDTKNQAIFRIASELEFEIKRYIYKSLLLRIYLAELEQ